MRVKIIERRIQSIYQEFNEYNQSICDECTFFEEIITPDEGDWDDPKEPRKRRLTDYPCVLCLASIRIKYNELGDCFTPKEPPSCEKCYYTHQPKSQRPCLRCQGFSEYVRYKEPKQ